MHWNIIILFIFFFFQLFYFNHFFISGTFFSEVVLNFFFCSFSIAGRGKSIEQRVIDLLRRNSKTRKKVDPGRDQSAGGRAVQGSVRAQVPCWRGADGGSRTRWSINFHDPHFLLHRWKELKILISKPVQLVFQDLGKIFFCPIDCRTQLRAFGPEPRGLEGLKKTVTKASFLFAEILIAAP